MFRACHDSAKAIGLLLGAVSAVFNASTPTILSIMTPTETPPVAWDEQGAPYSPRFGDRYRSEGLDGLGGLAQARHVFLAGCQLCEADGSPMPSSAWADAPRWRVLENGFGLGLNFLATWDLWRRDPRRPPVLVYEATEAFPPTAADIVRGAQAFEALGPLVHALTRHWSQLQERGALALENGAVQLHLHVGDALPTLRGLSTGVDAVFLDGFDPKLNPAMWSPELMQAVARLTRSGGMAATWCVARAVRDALHDAGFEPERRAGLPPKRHCLRARRQ